MNTRFLITAVVATMLVFCQQLHAQTEDDFEQAEMTELEGTWAVILWKIGGERKDSDGLFWRFEGNRQYFCNYDEHWTPSGTFSLNPSSTPAEIDLDTPDRTGIYKFENDLLLICFGDHQPDKFESTEDYPTTFLALYRVTETELEGTWEQVSLVTSGIQEETDGILMRFKGSRRYILPADDEEWQYMGNFSMDPSAMPAEIDFGPEDLGIYELDGDTLMICGDFMHQGRSADSPVEPARPVPTRPDKFESTEGSLTVLSVYRRVTVEESE